MSRDNDNSKKHKLPMEKLFLEFKKINLTISVIAKKFNSILKFHR